MAASKVFAVLLSDGAGGFRVVDYHLLQARADRQRNDLISQGARVCEMKRECSYGEGVKKNEKLVTVVPFNLRIKNPFKNL